MPERSTIIRTIAVGTAVVGLAAAAKFHSNIAEYFDPTCAAPSASALAAADMLMQTPMDSYDITAGDEVTKQQKAAIGSIMAKDYKADPKLTSQQLQTEAYEEYDDSQAGYAGQDTYAWLYHEHVAEETGVTLHDPRKFSVPLEWALKYDPQMSFSEYLSAAQAYASEFDITVELAGADPVAADLPSDMKAPTLEDLNNPTAEKDVVALIEALSSMPQQYVEVAGVKKVLIATNANPKEGSPDAAYAVTSGAHDTIVMNFGYSDNASVYEHETFHEVDSDMCGGSRAMDNDSAF